MLTYKFTIGCDPEVFVTRKGNPFSAYGVLEGTKESPHKTDLGAYQVDGMAAEFNTDPVGLRTYYNARLDSHFGDWNERIIAQIAAIREALPSDCRIKVVPTMEFGQEFLDKQPEAAKELGCDPDYNAYTLKANPRPDGERTFRTGAGHVHVGWGADIPTDNEEHMEICASFVKTLDATLGMFMTLVDRDPLRRELYGKAGAFRPKPYGVEYRTPSNIWIQNRALRRCVWDLVQLAIDWQTQGRDAKYITSFTEEEVREIIDNGDVERAMIAMRNIRIRDLERGWRWFDRNNLKFPSHFKRALQAAEKKYNA